MVFSPVSASVTSQSSPRGAVIGHPPVLDGHVHRAGAVVQEVVDERLALVAQTEDEAAHAEGGVELHDVP